MIPMTAGSDRVKGVGGFVEEPLIPPEKEGRSLGRFRPSLSKRRREHLVRNLRDRLIELPHRGEGSQRLRPAVFDQPLVPGVLGRPVEGLVLVADDVEVFARVVRAIWRRACCRRLRASARRSRLGKRGLKPVPGDQGRGGRHGA